MSNYPPGVTGMEYAIAGPDSETVERTWVEHECDEPHEKDFTGYVDAEVTRWGYEVAVEFTCPQCGEKVRQDAEAEDEAEAYED